MTHSAQTLGDLPIGALGVIRGVACARPVARRLMEMGLLPGTPVQVVRVAPLGDPIEIRVRGYSLSVRRADAAGIALGGSVQVEPASECVTGLPREGVT